MPPLNPDVADLAPCDQALTAYDKEHAVAGDGRCPPAGQLERRDTASAARREPAAAFGARPCRGQRAALWLERRRHSHRG
jgi:hypothetical protein